MLFLDLFIYIKSLRVSYFIIDSFDLMQESFIFLISLFWVPLKNLNKLIILLFFNESFKLLDFLIILARFLPDCLDNTMEGGSLSYATVMHKSFFLYHLSKLRLKGCYVCKIFFLNLRILDFNNSQVLFVFFWKLSESLSELASFLTVEWFRVFSFILCSIK